MKNSPEKIKAIFGENYRKYVDVVGLQKLSDFGVGISYSHLYKLYRQRIDFNLKMVLRLKQAGLKIEGIDKMLELLEQEKVDKPSKNNYVQFRVEEKHSQVLRRLRDIRHADYQAFSKIMDKLEKLTSTYF